MYESAAPSPCTPMPCLLSRPLSAAAMRQRGAEGSLPIEEQLILTESGCPAARAFAIAEPTARHSLGVLHASIAHIRLHCACGAMLNMQVCVAPACLHCTRGAALHMPGCIAHAYLRCTHKAALHTCLHYTYGAAFHIWACTACTESSCALHFVPMHFRWAPRRGTPQGNWPAPYKPGPLNLHQGQIPECLLHPECAGGSQVTRGANVDHFVCSHRPAGRSGLGTAW